MATALLVTPDEREKIISDLEKAPNTEMKVLVCGDLLHSNKNMMGSALSFSSYCDDFNILLETAGLTLLVNTRTMEMFYTN